MKTGYPSSKKGIPKNKFSQADDQQLAFLVEKHGPDNWKMIAQEMPGRTPRQCRERWINYASPQLSNSPWTPEEEQILYTNFKIHGPRWHKLSSFFPNRSANNILTHYKNMIKKGTFQELENQTQEPTIQQISSEKPTNIVDSIFTNQLDFDLDNILANDF